MKTLYFTRAAKVGYVIATVLFIAAVICHLLGYYWAGTYLACAAIPLAIAIARANGHVSAPTRP